MEVLKGKIKNQFENWYLKFIRKEREDYNKYQDGVVIGKFNRLAKASKYGVILEFIREERGVLIGVYRNASGYLWQMQKNAGGTSLGYSEHEGNCEMSGAYIEYNDAMDHAIELELTYGSLVKFRLTKSHWGNYATWLVTQEKESKPKILEAKVESSNLSKVKYHIKERFLDVTFTNGGEYRYKNVDRSIYDGFLTAESVGKYLRSCGLLSAYEFEKIEK